MQVKLYESKQWASTMQAVLCHITARTVATPPFHNACRPAHMARQRVTNNGALQVNRFRGPEVTVPSIHDVGA